MYGWLYAAGRTETMEIIAAEAAMRIHDHYGQIYIDRTHGMAFGLDRIRVLQTDQGWELINEHGSPRTLRVVYEDGTARNVPIEDKVVLN